MATCGTFYGLGIGPGEPELMSLKAHRLLTEAEVVFVPAKKEGEKSYAVSIAEQFLDFSKQERVDLLFPMTKKKEVLEASWKKAVTKILDLLQRGKSGVFLTEGDPFLYSTFIYLYQRLQPLLPEGHLQVVPGIPALCASAAAGGIPIVDSNDTLVLLPSTYGVEKLQEYLSTFDTVVLMKINSVLQDVLAILENEGVPAKHEVLFVERCGRPEQRIITDIASLKAMEKPNYLSLLIVKKRKVQNES